jgi:DNA-binding response OmpR family regulator
MAKRLILLIEHEPSVREILHVCLSQLGGWNVYAVSTLKQGVHMLECLEPQAILLDAPFLDIDHYDVVTDLRAYSDPLNIPILLITDKAKWFSKRLLAEIGVIGALAKPFDPLTLPNQISKLLNWQEEVVEVRRTS